MRKLHRFFAVQALLIFSCSNIMVQNKWNIIHGEGIKADNTTFKSLFFDHMNALLIGSSYTNEDVINKRFNNFNAIVYSSADGGHNWSERDLGKGEFTSCCAKDSFVCTSLRKSSGNFLSPSPEDSTFVYFSKDLGKNWELMSKLNDFFIQNIFFVSDKKIVLIGKKSKEKDWTILITSNRGLTWTRKGEMSADSHSPTISNGSLFYLLHKYPQKVIMFSIDQDKTDTITIQDSKFKSYLLSVTNNQLYIFGNSTSKIDIYNLGIDAVTFKYVTSIKEDKFPIQIYSLADRLILLLGSRNSVGVTYSVYVQKNHNGNWAKIPVPTSVFKPYAFSNENLWGYSNDNNFFVIDLMKYM